MHVMCLMQVTDSWQQPNDTDRDFENVLFVAVAKTPTHNYTPLPKPFRCRRSQKIHRELSTWSLKTSIRRNLGWNLTSFSHHEHQIIMRWLEMHAWFTCRMHVSFLIITMRIIIHNSIRYTQWINFNKKKFPLPFLLSLAFFHAFVIIIIIIYLISTTLHSFSIRLFGYSIPHAFLTCRLSVPFNFL